MSLLAKSKGEVTYKELSTLHKWALVVLISMGSSIIYAPMYLKNVFYDPLMQALGATNADLGLMVSAYGIAAMICYLPSGIVADKFRMRTLAWVGFIATAVLVFVYAMLPSVQICLILFVLMGVTSILVWWGTRFKVIRLCCEENEYASKIGISYSIYGVTGLVIGLINAGIIAAISGSAGVQAMLIFLGVVIAVLGVVSFFIIPDFKGEINKDAKLFSVKEAIQAIKHPGVIWACVAYFACYAVYQGATYTTPYLTQCFNADGNLVNIVGLIRTYGIGLIAGPIVGFIATKTPPLTPSWRLHPVHRGTRRLHPVPAGSLRPWSPPSSWSCSASPTAPLHRLRRCPSRIPMAIFGTASGRWPSSASCLTCSSTPGTAACRRPVRSVLQHFGFEIMFGVIGCIALVMLLRSIKKHFGASDAVAAAEDGESAKA
ncbi:MAG: MFS transporter [Eggerthella lenta]